MSAKEWMALLHFRFSNHQQQTNGFTLDYIKADDETIRNLTDVFPETLQGLSNDVLKAIAPKHRPKLRRQISYLIGLRQRQAEAWERYKAYCQERCDNVNQWLEAHNAKQNG